MTRELQDRFGVRGGETFVGRVQIWQPHVVQVLARAEGDDGVARHLHAEDVLGVFRHAGRVAVAPDRVDGVDVGQLPVAQDYGYAIGGDAGLFVQFARGSGRQRLV